MSENPSQGVQSEKGYNKDIIHTLRELKRVCVKSPNTHHREVINKYLDKIERWVLTRGLNGDIVLDIVKWSLGDDLDLVTFKKVVLLLIPNTKLPLDVYLVILSSITKLKGTTKNIILLRWVICLIELNYYFDNSELSKTYSILFHYLDYETLRPWISHLIFRITKPSHVQPFRIRAVMELVRRNPQDLYLIGLLNHFKSLRPTNVIVPVRRRPETIFRSPNPAWQAIVQNMGTHWGLVLGTSDSQLIRSADPDRLKSKRRKIFSADIPLAQTKQKPSLGKVPFQFIRSFSDLIDHLGSVEAPDQPSSIIHNQYYAFYCLLNLNHLNEILPKVNQWLELSLKEGSIYSDNSNRDQTELTVLLRHLVNLGTILGFNLDAVNSFLGYYLLSWDGLAHQDLVLKLISMVRPNNFNDLNELILQPLMRLTKMANFHFKAAILNTLNNLIRNWIIWFKQMIPIRFDRFKDVIMGIELDFILLIKKLVKFAEKTALVLVTGENDHLVIINEVINWFDLISTLIPKHRLPLFLLPNRALLTRILLIHSPTLISHTCSTLVNCKSSFEAYNQTISSNLSLPSLPADSIASLNATVLDYCNVLWKFKAFHNTGLDLGLDSGFNQESSPKESPHKVELIRRNDKTLDCLGLKFPWNLLGELDMYSSDVQGVSYSAIWSLFLHPAFIHVGLRWLEKQAPSPQWLGIPLTNENLTRLVLEKCQSENKEQQSLTKKDLTRFKLAFLKSLLVNYNLYGFSEFIGAFLGASNF